MQGSDATFEEQFCALFQQSSQYRLTTKLLQKVDKFSTAAILQACHSEQKTSSNIFQNQTAIVKHFKNNCGQSRAALNFSPEYKSLGRKLPAPSDLQPIHSHLVLLCPTYVSTKFGSDICNIGENRKIYKKVTLCTGQPRKTEVWKIAFQDGIQLKIPWESTIKYHKLNEAIYLFNTTSSRYRYMVAYWNCPH